MGLKLKIFIGYTILVTFLLWITYDITVLFIITAILSCLGYGLYHHILMIIKNTDKERDIIADKITAKMSDIKEIIIHDKRPLYTGTGENKYYYGTLSTSSVIVYSWIKNKQVFGEIPYNKLPLDAVLILEKTIENYSK